MKSIFKVLLVMIIVVGFTAPVYAKIVQKTRIKTKMIGNLDIHVERIIDPDHPWVGIFFSHVNDSAPLATSDPSNNCIATRAISQIPRGRDGLAIVNKKYKNSIIKRSKSWLMKSLKIARSWDEGTQSLIYTIYFRKGFAGGSLKHSISIVPTAPGIGL